MHDMNGLVGTEPTRLTFRRGLILALANGLFYSRADRWMASFASRFQVKTTGDGTWAFPFVRRRRGRNVQILTYHRVNDDRDPFFPATSVETFSRQMEYLASHYQVYSLEEIVQRLKARDVPEKALVVTFDDGYRDNYTNAFPILKRFSIPATVFLATDSIGTGKVLWHDRVFSAFRETQETTLSEYHPDVGVRPLRTLADKLRALWSVIRMLRKVDDVTREELIQRLITRLHVEDRCDDHTLMLDWQEVRTMYQHGISFGAHTASHPILSRLPQARVREEIQKSTAAIESQLGQRPQTFAYPNGLRDDFNESVKLALQEAGYQCAVTSLFGTNGPDQDLFELRRGQPWEEHLPTFAVKLSWYRMAS